jgi:hypothetical protein
MKQAIPVVLVTTLLACGGNASPSKAGSTLRVVSAPPGLGTPLARHSVAVEAMPRSLGLMGGAMVAGTASGLFAAAAPGADATAHVMVASTDGATDTGSISALAQRDNGELLVASDQGLFVGSDAGLVSSPLTQSLPKLTFSSVSASGADTNEELWLLSSQGLLHVAAQQVSQVSFGGAGTPALVAAGSAGEALVVSGGSLWDVTLAANDATELATGLGTAYGAARDTSGTVWVASDAGLISRSSAGALSRFTFASAGAAPARVCGVFASSSGVFAATSTAVLQVTGDTAQVVGTVSQTAGACPIAVDSQGNIYVGDGSGLGRFPGGALPVSFAAQIKPFLVQHCQPCHANGTEGAPMRAYDQYDTARQYGSRIAVRVQDPQSPMPPSNAEVLKPSDIALIVRWTQEGYAP